MYNYLDPNQTNEARKELAKRGYSSSEIDNFVKQKREQQRQEVLQNKLQEQQSRVGLLELQKKEQDLLSGRGSDLTNEQTSAFQALKTLDKLKTIYGMGDQSTIGTRKDLSEGRNILQRLSRGTEKGIGLITGPSKKEQQMNQFRQLSDMMISEVSQAFGSGTPQAFEAETLRENMPNRSSTDAEAKAWFENVEDLLRSAAGQTEQLGQVNQKQANLLQGLNKDVGNLQQAESEFNKSLAPGDRPPAINIKGEIAQEGDLVIDSETGQLMTYSATPETNVERKFKDTGEGGQVNNSFIAFLANSEILPIAGSIIGGLSGMGVGSLATGAAGASIGKAMQQGLRELIDPDKQNLSDMAKAVVIEGTTDAILGAATFGLGLAAKGAVKSLAKETGEGVLKAAGKEVVEGGVRPGLRFVFGKPTSKLLSETAEAGAKGVSKEAVEKSTFELIEQAGKKTKRDIVARGLKVTPSQLKNYATKTGGRDLVEDLIQKMGLPKSGQAVLEAGEELSKSSRKALDEILEGMSLKTDEVTDLLRNVQYDYLTPQGNIKAGYKPAMDQIDDFIQEVGDYGDEIPGKELNNIKSRLQKAFKSTGEVGKSAAKEATADASRRVRKFLADAHPQYVNTNREKMLGYLAQDIGGKLTRKKANALMSFTDIGVASISPQALGVKKVADLFTGAFKDPLVQARILDKGLKTAAAAGNKKGVRNILRMMMRMGITFTADNVAESMAEQDSEATPGMMEQPPGMGLQPQQNQPGLNLSPQPQQNQPGLNLEGGGGMVNQPGFMYR
jgi:hypothetical protein